MLIHAPLKATTVESGETFNYYDPGKSLQLVQHQVGKIKSPRILAVVDGPPETTGPLARYPALEMLLEAFPSQHGFLLLDDFRRVGEQEIARQWQQLLAKRGIAYEVTEFPLEKKACLITLSPEAVESHLTKPNSTNKLSRAKRSESL